MICKLTTTIMERNWAWKDIQSAASHAYQEIRDSDVHVAKATGLTSFLMYLVEPNRKGDDRGSFDLSRINTLLMDTLLYLRQSEGGKQ